MKIYDFQVRSIGIQLELISAWIFERHQELCLLGEKPPFFCDNLREVNIWLVPWIRFHNPVLGNKVENRILHHWEAMSFFGLAVLVLGETAICDSYINRPAFKRGQASFAHLRSLWLGTNEQTHEKSSHAQHLLFLNASKLCCHLQNYKPQWSIYLS